MANTGLPVTWLESYARLFAKHERDRKAEIAALLARGYRVVYEDGDSIFITTNQREKMTFEYADAPEEGKFYRTSEGVIVQVEEIKPNGYWLGRFVFHPREERANHRQWNPWWSKGFFKETSPTPNQGKTCVCDACKKNEPPSLVPLGS